MAWLDIPVYSPFDALFPIIVGAAFVAAIVFTLVMVARRRKK